MRKLIAGMKISIDGKMEGPEGTADWVKAWSDDYGLTAFSTSPTSLILTTSPVRGAWIIFPPPM